MLLLYVANALWIGLAPIIPIMLLLQNALYRYILWNSHAVGLILILLFLVLIIYLWKPLKEEFRISRQKRLIRKLKSPTN